ncbi:hypothetical protein JYU34_002982 [Plutella xylostella]|uniref:Uncharacterized protein n=1 Tax=Plutella xylostella TaxID=51655 RepID=A0ABQ7R3M1_PLUXY|nr:hypothetical protein JYU34_002982 [Plutella xylostella]
MAGVLHFQGTGEENESLEYYKQKLDETLENLRCTEAGARAQGGRPCGLNDADEQLRTRFEQELERQRKVIRTLETDLSVIEELYRESFYESAKQEELIEKLRQSNIDIRLSEQAKVQEIEELRSIINTQQWSLERCQALAAEVETLKMDVLTLMDHSNDDSGVWEGAADVSDELRDIMGLLAQLQEALRAECVCDTKEENVRLKERIHTLELEVDSLRERIRELESCSSADDDDDDEDAAAGKRSLQPSRSNCQCGMERENKKLKKNNKNMQAQTTSLRKKLKDLREIILRYKTAQHQEMECTCGLKADHQRLTEELVRLEVENGALHQELFHEKEKQNNAMECACGLKDENVRLKQQNEELLIEMGDMLQKLKEYEDEKTKQIACLCGIRAENETMKEVNRVLQSEMERVRREMRSLEDDINDKEELESLRQELRDLESDRETKV